MTNRIFQRSTLTLVSSSSRFARSFDVDSERFNDFDSHVDKGLLDLESSILEVKISADAVEVTCPAAMASEFDEFDFEVDARWI